MAEKVAQQIKTSVLSITKWGKEKKDNRRLDIGYYNDMIYFSIAKPDAEGKFSDTKSLFFKNLNENTLSLIAAEIRGKIAKIQKKEPVASESICIFNGQSIKDAKNIVEFNAYLKEDRPTVYISIKKKKENGENEFHETFYFGQSHTVFRAGGTHKPEDLESYTFFTQMMNTFSAAGSRDGYIRSYHFDQWYKAQNNSGDTTGNKQTQYKKESSNNDSEDDFPF